MFPKTLPERFLATIRECYGEQGAEWLERLPKTLEAFADRWSLTLEPPYPNLSYNYVAPALRSDGVAVVLKVGVPHKEFPAEIAALRHYDGRGSVRLIDTDEVWNALLLERIVPGETLVSLATEANDEQATEATALVMKRLWRPAPPNTQFPTLADWMQGLSRLRAHYGGGTGAFPQKLVEEAETLSKDLLASSPQSVLLHGDLHHDNILSSEREDWLAIDPKGVLGDPAYEAGAMLLNLWEDRHTISHPSKIQARRIAQLSDLLAIPKERIWGWGVAQATLSAWWCIEDNDSSWRKAIADAERFASLEI